MISAVVIAIVAVVLGMQTSELKNAICDAPVLEQSNGL